MLWTPTWDTSSIISSSLHRLSPPSPRFPISHPPLYYPWWFSMFWPNPNSSSAPLTPGFWELYICFGFASLLSCRCSLHVSQALGVVLICPHETELVPWALWQHLSMVGRFLTREYESDMTALCPGDLHQVTNWTPGLPSVQWSQCCEELWWRLHFTCTDV